jgi:beta-phosphoglucomutase
MAVQIPSLNRIKAVIFDLDGVVVDSENAHLATFNSLLSQLGIKISRQAWRKRYAGVGSYAIMEDVFRRNGIALDSREWVGKRAAIYQKYVEKRGLPTIAGFNRFYALLKRHGLKVAIASGGHRSHIAASLRSIGVSGVPFVGLEDVKRRKPAPDAFLLAAKKLRVLPEECIAFEDSLAGVRAVAAAGMPCVALQTTLPRSALAGKAALIVKDYRSPKLRRLFVGLLGKR